MEIEPEPCPRCGCPVVQPKRGRRRIWCSDGCRRRGWDEGERIEIRERVVTREVMVPVGPTAPPIDTVLDSTALTLRFLDRLAARLRGTITRDESQRTRVESVLERADELAAVARAALDAPPLQRAADPEPAPEPEPPRETLPPTPLLPHMGRLSLALPDYQAADAGLNRATRRRQARAKRKKR